MLRIASSSHRACIVQEQSLERTEVGYPEFVEQTLQHNAEIVRAMCRVSNQGNGRRRKSSVTPCVACRKLGKKTLQVLKAKHNALRLVHPSH